MDVVKLDPGVNLKIAVRKGREHTLTVRFVSSGQPWPIVDDFALGVKINPLDRNYLFYLSTEDEIQVNGNELVIPFSEQNTSIDASRQHYYELVNLTRKENWLQGPYIVESGQAMSSPSSSSATLSINTGEQVVEITVQGGGTDISQLTDEQLQQLASEISRATSFDYQLDFYIQ